MNVNLIAIVDHRKFAKTLNVPLHVSNVVKELNVLEFQITARSVNARKITSVMLIANAELNATVTSIVQAVNQHVFMVFVKILVIR